MTDQPTEPTAVIIPFGKPKPPTAAELSLTVAALLVDAPKACARFHADPFQWHEYTPGMRLRLPLEVSLMVWLVNEVVPALMRDGKVALTFDGSVLMQELWQYHNDRGMTLPHP